MLGQSRRRKSVVVPGAAPIPQDVFRETLKDTHGKAGSIRRGTALGSVVNEDTFKDGFSLEGFVGELMKDVLRTKRYDPKGLEVSAAATASKLSLDKVQKLLITFDKVSEDLAHLQEGVANLTSELQRNVQREESHYKVELKVAEKMVEGIRDTFKELDSKTVRVSQTTTRIGDRLQNAESCRLRALEMVKLVGHLQHFINLPPGGDFSKLPPFFSQDATLSEAAAVVRKLLVMVKAAQSTTARGRRDDAGGAAIKADLGASLESTIRNMEDYCAMLERRIMERFDKGTEEKDVAKMRECAHIMAEFDRERTVIQRYVSSRPVFLETGDAERLLVEALAATDIPTRLKPLQYLHRDMLHLLRDEAAIVPQVFPSPKLTLDLLLQSLVEQRISPVLDRLLAAPGSKSGAAALQSWLALLSEAYERTTNFTSTLDKVAGGLLDTANMALDLFAHHLADYPMPELYGLHKCCEQVMRETDSAELKVESARKLLLAHGDAVKRCARLSSPSMVSRNVRMLFYAGQNPVSAGCLLEHLSRYVTQGLSYAADLCAQGSMATLASTGQAQLTSSLASQMAEAYVVDRVSWVLQACSAAGSIVEQLQQHYSSCVVPHVSSSLMDHATCNQGMLVHVKSMEAGVVAMLARCLDAFIGQVDKVLVSEQRRLDFCPRDGDLLLFDKPTNACLLLTSMLRALKRQGLQHLKGANLQAWHTDVGQRVFEALLLHMQRYVYSATGALKWKSDVSVYAECVADFDVPAVNTLFKQLQDMVNVLVVGPESLVGLVDGTLRMSHADVLKYVQLREDFKTARVNGQTLQQLFTAEAVIRMPFAGMGGGGSAGGGSGSGSGSGKK